MPERRLGRTSARSETRSDIGEATMCTFACGADRLSRAGRRADRREADVADTDETERLAQIWRRHVDAAAVHAGDEIAAAGEDHNRRPVLEQGQVALHRIKAECHAG